MVGIESRGFILGGAVADRIGAGFTPVRKPGKLPSSTISETYALEYGTDKLEIHDDAVRPGQRALIVDDVIATGGTARATAALVRRLGGTVHGLAFLVELAVLNGRAQLPGEQVYSVLKYLSRVRIRIRIRIRIRVGPAGSGLRGRAFRVGPGSRIRIRVRFRTGKSPSAA